MMLSSFKQCPTYYYDLITTINLQSAIVFYLEAEKLMTVPNNKFLNGIADHYPKIKKLIAFK